MGCFEDYGRACSPGQEIRQESRVIASQLDRGDPQIAADLLRRDLQTMPPGAAAALIRETQEKDQKGYGADLVVNPVIARDGYGRAYDTGQRNLSIYDNRTGYSERVATLNASPQPYYEARPGYPQQRIDPLAALSTVIIAGAIAGAINGGRRDHDRDRGWNGGGIFNGGRRDFDQDGDRRHIIPVPRLFPFLSNPERR